MKFGIFSQVFAAILVGTSVPLIALAYAYDRQVAESVRGAVDRELVNASSKVKTAVDDWTDTNIRLLNYSAQLEAVTSMQSEQQNPIMSSMVDNYDWLYQAAVTGLDGFMTARNDANQKPILNPDGSKAHFRGDRQYFIQVAEENKSNGQQVIISRTTDLPALCLSSPVQRNADLVGVLSSCSSLERISQVVADVKIGATGFAILVDKEGKAIAHGRPELVSEKLQDLSDSPVLRDGTVDRQTLIEDGDRQVLAYQQLAGLGWKLIVQQDTSEAFAPIAAARRNTIISLIGGIGLAAFLAYILARFLVRPIESLTLAADDISRGQLEAEIPETGRGDEIGALARAVKRLSVSFKLVYDELKGATK